MYYNSKKYFLLAAFFSHICSGKSIICKVTVNIVYSKWYQQRWVNQQKLSAWFFKCCCTFGFDVFFEFWKVFFNILTCIKKQRVHHCMALTTWRCQMDFWLPYTQQSRTGVVLQQRDSHSPASCQIFETIQVLQQVSTSGVALFLLTTSSAK